MAAAVREALRARGLLSSGPAPFELTVTVLKFESTQMVRREAEATMAVEVIDRATRKPIYSDQANVDLVAGSVLAFDTGIFASSADLQALAQKALVQAIDQLLDKPGFRSAIRSTGA